MAKINITSPVEGLNTSTAIGPLVLNFKDSVAEVKEKQLTPGVRKYLERLGYGIGDKKAKKDKGRRRNDAPKGHGPFRATALTLVNKISQPLNCTFYYRVKTDLDDYALPTAGVDRIVGPNESFRYDPDRYRVGVLIKHFITSHDVYADVRNKSYWLPTGGVTSGPDLDPPAGKTGSVLIREQAFDFNESHFANLPRLSLKRKRDSDTHIEWELTVTQI